MEREKHCHVFASKVAKMLIGDQLQWDQHIEVDAKYKIHIKPGDTLTVANKFKDDDTIKIEQGGKSSEGRRRQDLDECCITIEDDGKIFVEQNVRISELGSRQNPLFLATSGGITEIVEDILEVHPQAIELLNNIGQNLLHAAVLHRKKDVFNILQGKEILQKRMGRAIDNNGCTLLHHVADKQHYTPGTKPGPAFQLQDELIWLERAQDLCPEFYSTKEDEVEKKTAKMLFEERHKAMLDDARKWIKETSQSCSTVAVLVATVVYAAAYTVPGGSNNKGIPVFIQSPYFMFFTVTDVISLAASLTSVVMFLSILTSPCELENFRHSLPWKLNLGFVFLFLSIITTMLSFGATILLMVRGQKGWTTSLISVAAFLPVSVFAIMQHQLYSAFWENMQDFFTLIIRKSIKKFHLMFRSRRKPDVTKNQ